MTATRSPEATDASLTRDILYALRYYLGGRRGLIALGVIVVAAALVLNWSWLVAAGIAPLLLTLLPCAAMCALGLCISRIGGRSCSTNAPSTQAISISDDNDRAVPSDPGREALPSPPLGAAEIDDPPGGSEPQFEASEERKTTDV